MARSIGYNVPQVLAPLFTGEDLPAHEGLTFLLLSNTAEGWPHLAMLSVGEVLLAGERNLLVALWRGSTAAGNLGRTGLATLALVHQGAGYSLRCQARQQPDLDLSEHGRLAFFALEVQDVLEDSAPYADLTSGVSFRLKDPSQVLPRWQDTVEAMRARRESGPV
jgi:hypothetical protein